MLSIKREMEWIDRKLFGVTSCAGIVTLKLASISSKRLTIAREFRPAFVNDSSYAIRVDRIFSGKRVSTISATFSSIIAFEPFDIVVRVTSCLLPIFLIVPLGTIAVTLRAELMFSKRFSQLRELKAPNPTPLYLKKPKAR
jgi:hypothetical protein